MINAKGMKDADKRNWRIVHFFQAAGGRGGRKSLAAKLSASKPLKNCIWIGEQTQLMNRIDCRASVPQMNGGWGFSGIRYCVRLQQRIVILNSQQNIWQTTTAAESSEQQLQERSLKCMSLHEFCISLSLALALCRIQNEHKRSKAATLFKVRPAKNDECVMCGVWCVPRATTTHTHFDPKKRISARNGCIKCFERARAQHTSPAWANYQRRTMRIYACWLLT